jgi:hypothetical protein
MLRRSLHAIRRRLGCTDDAVLFFSLGAIGASFALMFWNLGAQPFWVDEAIAAFPSQRILREGVPSNPLDLDFMAPQLQDDLWDPSAPLYRYALAAVAAVFGFSETTTRGFSVLAALVLLLPCFLLFRRLYGASTALLACAFLSAMPHFADFSREARHFAFVACLMAFTLYFLFDASCSDGRERSRGLWPLFLLATVLSHAIGYLVIPVVAVGLLLGWNRPILSKRYLPWNAIGLLLYAALQAKYYETLPFFHSVGCHNQPAGCHPGRFHYLGIFLTFLNGADFAHDPSPFVLVGNLFLPVTLFGIGLVVVTSRMLKDHELRPGHALTLAWLLVPLILLSTRDVKFPRYLFYILPPAALFMARGLTALRLKTPILLALAAAVVLAPRLTETREGRERSIGFESRYLEHAVETSLDPPPDNWENIGRQVAFLEKNLQPGDIVVTSLDDGSLAYYLGRFVHGFLDSAHDDEFFLRLLSEARRRGSRLWFVDTLPMHNYCHTPGREPVSVDCRLKYRRFYEACLPSSPTFDPTCARLRFH